MPGRFSISFPGRRDHDDPWFRIGTLDVTTAVLVPLLCVVSMFVWSASPALLAHLDLWPPDVRAGQVWRVVTWPLANEPDFWTLITLAIFWYFGRELERMVGRVRFLWLLVWLAVVPGIVGTALDLYQAGIRPIELAVFVVFCLELPQVRFFGAVPAWGFALAIVGVEILQLIGLRDSDGIALLAVSLATALLVARSFGLLSHYAWIPNLRPGSARTGSRPERRRKRAKSGNTVVSGPWQGSAPAHSADEQAELDALLDTINARGFDSLSRDEKARLNELSKKLRGR